MLPSATRRRAHGRPAIRGRIGRISPTCARAAGDGRDWPHQDSQPGARLSGRTPGRLVQAYRGIAQEQGLASLPSKTGSLCQVTPKSSLQRIAVMKRSTVLRVICRSPPRPCYCDGANKQILSKAAPAKLSLRHLSIPFMPARIPDGSVGRGVPHTTPIRAATWGGADRKAWLGRRLLPLWCEESDPSHAVRIGQVRLGRVGLPWLARPKPPACGSPR